MLANDLQTGFTGSTVPTVIGDVASAATSIFAAVSGRPVSTVQAQVVATQQPGLLGGGSSGLLWLLIIGGVIYLIARR